ncbi:MAG: tannase/feruloyl esterase family alpha/beta hydrolase [Acidobacteria bacterium]|nr:MAG: tannase/feruloyl esterase family alpha/beta hydrolase [Acidobacteriota bacterium]
MGPVRNRCAFSWASRRPAGKARGGSRPAVFDRQVTPPGFGWADTALNPMRRVNYFEDVRATMGEATAADVYRLFMVPGMFHLPRRARHGPLRYADAARELGRGRHRSGPDSGGSCGQRRSDPQPPPGVRIRRSRRTPARAASTTRAISSAPFPDASAPSQHRYRVDVRRAPRRDEHRRTPHREQHCDHRDRRHRVGRVHAEEEP